MHLSLPVQACRQGVEKTLFAGRRILVVEDEFLVSVATTDLLESVGCVIVGPAACLTAALQLARSEPLDAAVLDIDIAGEKVWPVAEQLSRRKIPFLLLSAYHPPNETPAHISTAPYLQKPLEGVRLLRALGAMWKN